MSDHIPNLDPSLKKEEGELIIEECNRYQKCHENITTELKIKTDELNDNHILARELTTQLVTTRRDEEKQFLQSDENVAHGLVKVRTHEMKALECLIDQSYFARVVYHEKNRDIEFKLGFASFPKERIIDWRKAPISKLYYDYEEGDEYDDEIAGVERKGEIKVKRAYRGKAGNLSAIELRECSYILSKEVWHKQKKQQHSTFSIKDKQKIKELLASQDANVFSRVDSNDDGYLPQILSLLTPEQFRLISSDINKPVIIQGSAGTGKTTVALHRLAWLLFEENSPAKEENTLVMMFNSTLANYVKNVLPDMNVNKVKITTYFDWADDIIATSLNSRIPFAKEVPEAVARFKSHHKTLACLESYLETHPLTNSPAKDLLDFYASDFWKTGLPQNQVNSIAAYLKNQAQKISFDTYDIAYLLHLIFAKDFCYRTRKYPAELDHLVIDEAQDFTIIELKSILNALTDKNQLTLAGDLGQKILENRDFGTWAELLDELDLKGTDVLNLNIAYRSTYQIYEVAQYVRDPNLKESDLELTAKFGPDPILKLCHNFGDAIGETKKWIEDITQVSRSAIAVIICKTPSEARDVYHALLKSGTHGVRLGDVRHFDFTPGITVTDVRQIKGLEFRNLMLFNPSLKNYSADNIHDRNLLYVAITRAEERLDFICYEAPSVMLPEFIVKEDLTEMVEEEEDESGRPKPKPEKPWYEEEDKELNTDDADDGEL